MVDLIEREVVVFDGDRLVASGSLVSAALEAKGHLDKQPLSQLLILGADDGETIEVDFRGSSADLSARLEKSRSPETPITDAERGPGRPKLGVVAREVTLLPRHWEWLNKRSGGASAVLRKLVEMEMRRTAGEDRRHAARDAAHRFMLVVAGDKPGFEEASRALFAGNRDLFQNWTMPWPPDVRDHARRMAEGAFETSSDEKNE